MKADLARTMDVKLLTIFVSGPVRTIGILQPLVEQRELAESSQMSLTLHQHECLFWDLELTNRQFKMF
jgi:hypothetical protein